MSAFGKNIIVLVGCFGLLFGLTTAPGSAAQTKTKKNSKAENAAIAANKTPVDLNTSSEQDLSDLPGIGPALAKKIIASRPYSSVSDLSKASVPAKTIKKIRPMVTVRPAPAAADARNSTSGKVASPSESPAASSPKSTNKTATAAPVTQAEGGGSGKVWVNTKSGVYHKQGDKWYGKTKQGKYMTEDEAVKAGYRADKEKQANKKD